MKQLSQRNGHHIEAPILPKRRSREADGDLEAGEKAGSPNYYLFHTFLYAAVSFERGKYGKMDRGGDGGRSRPKVRHESFAPSNADDYDQSEYAKQDLFKVSLVLEQSGSNSLTCQQREHEDQEENPTARDCPPSRHIILPFKEAIATQKSDQQGHNMTYASKWYADNIEAQMRIRIL